MKKVCVPRFAVMAKYVSRAGDLILSCIQARYGVSQRIRGRSFSRKSYLHGESLRLSASWLVKKECANGQERAHSDLNSVDQRLGLLLAR